MGLSAAKDSRFSPENLHKNLLVVQAHDKGTAQGNDGNPYTWVRATVAVIDGPVSDELEEKAGTSELPIVLEDIRFTQIGFTSRLEGITGKYDEDGTPKLVFGRVGRYKNRNQGTSYSLDGDNPSEADTAKASKYVAEEGAFVFPDREPADRAAKAFA